MSLPLTPRARARRGALLGLCLALGGAARAQDPFQPGLSWRSSPDPLAPAIPREAVLAAQGNFLWTASSGGSTRFELFDALREGAVTPPLAAITVPGALGAVGVAASETGTALFALVQVPAPDATHRATLVSRVDALSAATSGQVASAWTFDSGLRANGPGRIAASADGAHVAIASWNGPLPEARVDVLDGASGASLAHVVLPAASLNALATSAGANRVAVAAGTVVWILDGACNVRHQEGLPAATSALALSGDGSLIAAGGSRVRVLAERAAGYATAFEVAGVTGEIAVRLALSRDGSTLAIGWWNAGTGLDSRFELVDVATRARLFERALSGAASGLQNAPEVVRLAPDGSRAAFAAWGDGGSAPEVLLCDRGLAAPALEIDLPGSPFALALDPAGERLVVGLKGAHANQFGASGEFRAYHTGRSDTVVLAPPRPGGTMLLAARRAGAHTVAFLAGPRLASPVTLPGVGGTLFLDRSQLVLVRKPSDATGRADLAVPIPNDPLLVGTWRHLQSAFLQNGVWTLGSSVLDVLVH